MTKSISAKLQKYRTKVLKKAKRGISETTVLLHSNASSRAPVDTGGLKNSIGMSISSFQGEVKVGAKHGVYIEFGTGVYSTKGSRAKKIPWSYQKDGRWYTTRGMVAQPFWYPSLDVARQYFKSYFNY